MLEKAAALKRFKYSPLRSVLKKKTSVAEKQYQGLNQLFKYDKREEEPVIIKKEKPAIISASKLMHDNKYSFSNYKNVRKYIDLSFTTKYHKLLLFYHRLNEFRNLIPRTEKTKLNRRMCIKMLKFYIIHR